MAKKMEQSGMMDKSEMKEPMSHLQNHIMYPASKRTIIESCNKMEHVPAYTRMWVERTFPKGPICEPTSGHETGT